MPSAKTDRAAAVVRENEIVRPRLPFIIDGPERGFETRRHGNRPGAVVFGVSGRDGEGLVHEVHTLPRGLLQFRRQRRPGRGRIGRRVGRGDDERTFAPQIPSMFLHLDEMKWT